MAAEWEASVGLSMTQASNKLGSLETFITTTDTVLPFISSPDFLPYPGDSGYPLIYLESP